MDHFALFNSHMHELRNAGRVALKEIPVEIIKWDTSYQTWERTSCKQRVAQIQRLALRWDENKLEPITVVPHPEEGYFYVVNGYGRLTASQMLAKPYTYLTAIVLLGALEMNPQDRRVFESDLFAKQNEDTSILKPIQKHGALLNVGNPAITLIEKMKNEYGFGFASGGGSRECGVIGSYTKLVEIAKYQGENCLRYIFDVCKQAAFNRKPNGYSRYVLMAVRDAWVYHPEDREKTETYLGSTLRKMAPEKLRKAADSHYPDLSSEVACSLHLEDLFVAELGLKRKREYKDGRVVKIA